MGTCNLCGHTCHCSKDGMCMEKNQCECISCEHEKEKS